jgi:predicted transposase/invertase (TIGR01784 family)
LYFDPVHRVSLDGKTKIITIELVKTKHIADKSVKDMTNAELWAVFFQYLTDPGKRAKIIEIINHEEGIAMAVAALGAFTQNEIEYMRQTAEIMAELDWNSAIKVAKQKALKEGLKEGRAKGRAEGEVRGREAGRAEVARNALALGLTPEFVQKITGLDMQTITSFK